MKTINKLGTVIRGIMIQQIIKTYQETKGELPGELKEALDKANMTELQETLTSLPAIIQAEMATQMWKEFKKNMEDPKGTGVKKTFLN